MRARLALLLAAVRWRRSGSAAVLLGAALAFAAACLGPLWAAASEDAVGSAAVARATPLERSLAVSAEGNETLEDTLVPTLAVRAAEQAAVLPAPAEAAFGPARTSLRTVAALEVEVGERTALGTLAWQGGACEALRLVAGRCPSGRGEVLLSSRSATLLGTRAGGTVDLTGLGDEPVVAGRGTPFPVRYRVAGLYVPGDPEAETWAGTGWFAFLPVSPGSVRDAVPATLDAMFGTRELLDALSTTPVTAQVRRSFDAVPRSAPDRLAVQRALESWSAGLDAAAGGIAQRTPVLALLEAQRSDGEQTRRTSLLLGLQLLLLACWGLTVVVAASLVARADDTALASLRGFGRRTTVALGLGEPLLLVLLALPLGLLVGSAATTALAAAVLPGEVSLRPDGVLLLSVASAAAGAVVAVVLGVRRALSATVLPSARRRPGESGARVLAGEAVLVALAIAAVVQVLRDDTGRGLGLLVPALTGLALGVVVARLRRVLLQGGLRLSRDRGGAASFLAVRTGARREGSTALVALLAVTVSLGLYGAGVLSVSEEQRASQAAMETGARSVYEVAPGPVTRLSDAVAEIDPTGSRLAAVVRSTGARGVDGERLVAVDTGRLAAVAAWRDEWSAAPVRRLAAALAPPQGPSLTITGTTLELVLRDAPDGDTGPGTHVLRLRDREGRPRLVRLDPVVDIARPRTMSAEIPECARGCLLTSLEIAPEQTEPQLPLIGTVRYVALRVDGREVPGAFADPTAWRAVLPVPRDPSPFAQDPIRLRADGGALEVRYVQDGQDAQDPRNGPPSVVVVRADVPEHVPVLVAGDTALPLVGQDDLVRVPRLDGQRVTATVVDRTTVLPFLGDGGLLTDLRVLDRASSGGADDGTVMEVWSSGPADATTREALRSAGLDVVGVRDADRRQRELDGAGTAKVLLLLPAVALAALLVAAAAMAAQALSVARARAVQSAALGAVGVPVRTSRRAGTVDGVGVVVAAVIAGGLAALLSTALTAGSVLSAGLPEPLAPFPEAQPLAVLLLAALAVGGLLALLAVVCARVGVRQARAEDLRQGTT